MLAMKWVVCGAGAWLIGITAVFAWVVKCYGVLPWVWFLCMALDFIHIPLVRFAVATTLTGLVLTSACAWYFEGLWQCMALMLEWVLFVHCFLPKDVEYDLLWTFCCFWLDMYPPEAEAAEATAAEAADKQDIELHVALASTAAAAA